MRQDVEADPPNLIKGYARVMLRPMEKKSSTKSSSSINRSSIFGNSLFCLHGRAWLRGS